MNERSDEALGISMGVRLHMDFSRSRLAEQGKRLGGIFRYVCRHRRRTVFLPLPALSMADYLHTQSATNDVATWR